MMRLRLQMLAPVSTKCSWKRRMSSSVAVSGERLRNAANRLQLLMWPLCVPAHSLRAYMSSIRRWRSGLTVSVVMDDSCLGLGGSHLDLQDRAPRPPPTISPSRQCSRLRRPPQRVIAQRFRCYGARRGNGTIVAATNRWSAPMPQPNDLSRSLVTLEQDSTLIAVIEMGQSSWLVAGIVPGIERQPLKKLTADQDGLLQLLHRWR